MPETGELSFTRQLSNLLDIKFLDPKVDPPTPYGITSIGCYLSNNCLGKHIFMIYMHLKRLVSKLNVAIDTYSIA